MTVSMGMLIFAGLGYALEKDEEDTMFYTLPQTLYWAIITMTSTGYGDISPKTSAGMTLMTGDYLLLDIILPRQAGGLTVRHMWCALHNSAHSHHCGKL